MGGTKWREGWAVMVTCKDGSLFFATTGEGEGPAIYSNPNRKYAREFVSELKDRNIKARIVPIRYCEPVVIEKKAMGKK